MARAIKRVEIDTAVVKDLGEKAAPDLEAGIKPPPEVAILSPLPGKQFDSDVQEVKIVAEDMGGGIDEVLLYQNGKLLPRCRHEGKEGRKHPGASLSGEARRGTTSSRSSR